jgi:hypothetical protein
VKKTCKEVADELGLSIRRVQQGAKTLGVEKMGRDYLWSVGDVRRLAERIGKRDSIVKTAKKKD